MENLDDGVLDLGVRGWSIPGAVATWQANPLERSLGGHLHQWSLTVTPLEDRDTAPFSDDWFAELPTDGTQVA